MSAEVSNIVLIQDTYNILRDAVRVENNGIIRVHQL